MLAWVLAFRLLNGNPSAIPLRRFNMSYSAHGLLEFAVLVSSIPRNAIPATGSVRYTVEQKKQTGANIPAEGNRPSYLDIEFGSNCAMISEIERGQVLNLPIHGERLTFGIGWTPGVDGAPVDFDLSAVLLNKHGEVIDCVYHRCLSAKGFCVRHMGDERGGQCHESEEDEQICVYPAMVPEAVQAIFFVASAVSKEGDQFGFMRPGKLHFSVTSFDPAR